MKRLFLALALLLAPAAASAQCNGTFPNNTVCGNVTGSANLPRPTNPASFLGAAGGTNGQIQYNNGGALAGATGGDVQMSGTTTLIQPSAVTNGKIAPGAANTMKGSTNGSATSDIALVSCSVAYRFTQWVTGTGWQCGISPILPSRAIAASLDLSAFTAITTQSYETPGDGGGATFKRQGTAPFYDSYVTGITVTNPGVGCTDGNYLGVYYGGGSGEGVIGIVNVSGGAVTSANVTTPGNRYAVGDVLNQNGFFTCATTDPAFTVATVSTPTGSFTDSAGNRWQITPDGGGSASILQFGAKCDWHHSTGDAAATDDTTAIQNALNYGYGGAGKAVQGYVGAGGVAGMRITMPTGYCMTSSFTVPCYVMLIGPGMWSGGPKARDNLDPSVNYIDVGDRFTHQACFGAGLYDMNIFPGSGAANSGTYMVFSNNVQQHTFMARVTVSGGQRGAISVEDGWGGAAMLGFEQIEAGTGQTAMPVIRLAYSTAVTILNNVIVENGGTFCHYPAPCTGVAVINGYIRVAGFHSEGIAFPINIFNVNPQGISSFHNLTCGAGTNACVTRQVTATAGLAVIGTSYGNGATLNNAGVFTTGNILDNVVF